MVPRRREVLGQCSTRREQQRQLKDRSAVHELTISCRGLCSRHLPSASLWLDPENCYPLSVSGIRRTCRYPIASAQAVWPWKPSLSAIPRYRSTRSRCAVWSAVGAGNECPHAQQGQFVDDESPLDRCGRQSVDRRCASSMSVSLPRKSNAATSAALAAPRTSISPELVSSFNSCPGDRDGVVNVPVSAFNSAVRMSTIATPSRLRCRRRASRPLDISSEPRHEIRRRRGMGQQKPVS